MAIDKEESQQKNLDAKAGIGLATPVKRYIEPATLLTITIGAIYYLGWLNVDSYFSRVGLNHLSLDLATTYYLKQGYLAVTIAWVFSYWVYLMDRNPPKSRQDAIFPNLLILFIVFSVLPFFPSPSNESFQLSLVVFTITLVIIVVATWKKKSLIHSLRPETLIGRFAIIFGIFSLLSINAITKGELSGRYAIEGKNRAAPGITFTWKDQSIAELEGKNLILILHNNGKYYVVEKQNPAPDYPRAYIIPDEIVKYASTTLER